MYYYSSEKFLEAATNPEEWFRKSRELKQNGDVLWDKFEESRTDWEKKNIPNEEIMTELDEALSYLKTSQLLYGLALETIFNPTCQL